MKKTPLVGVFFIGGDGEPLEITASRESGRMEGGLGAACPERSEEVQYLSISDSKNLKQTHGIACCLS